MFGQISPVVKNLLILNVGIFILQNLLVGYVEIYGRDIYTEYVTFYGSLYGVKSDFFYPFQLITHMFLHGGFRHLLMNMLVLFFLGPILEQTIGDKKFLLLYMICGLGAGVSQLAVNYGFHVNPDIPMLGASGATMGVLMGTALFYPNLEMRLYFFIPIKLKYLALLAIVIDLFGGFGGQHTGIAHFAHLGGVLFSIALIAFWKKKGLFN